MGSRDPFQIPSTFLQCLGAGRGMRNSEHNRLPAVRGAENSKMSCLHPSGLNDTPAGRKETVQNGPGLFRLLNESPV